jgi:hypothetical protein
LSLLVSFSYKRIEKQTASVSTQKPDLLEKYNENKTPPNTTISEHQSNLLIKVVKMIEEEGTLKKHLFTESDLSNIKGEIKQ